MSDHLERREATAFWQGLRRCGWAWAAALLLALASSGATAQTGSRVPPSQRPTGSERTQQTSAGAQAEDEFNTGSMRHRLELARAADRMRRMQDDANRLLELSRAVSASASERDELSPADHKRLDDIVKLARAVRERMKQ